MTVLDVGNVLVKNGEGYYVGDYVNPRDTFGWKNKWIKEASRVTEWYTWPEFEAEYLENFDLNKVEAQLKKARTPFKKCQALCDILGQEEKMIGGGDTPEHLYNDAVRRLRRVYSRIASGYYENFNALKWSYLANQDVFFVKVMFPTFDCFLSIQC